MDADPYEKTRPLCDQDYTLEAMIAYEISESRSLGFIFGYYLMKRLYLGWDRDMLDTKCYIL